jgi:hypothetical protein
MLKRSNDRKDADAAVPAQDPKLQAWLDSLPPERKCACGQKSKGECWSCNRAELLVLGGRIEEGRGESRYILPDGREVSYLGLYLWLKGE